MAKNAFLFIVLGILMVSCSTNKFKPIYFTENEYLNKSNSYKLFTIYNEWVKNSLDSLFFLNKTVYLDSLGLYNNEVTSFKIKYETTGFIAKNKDYVRYSVYAIPNKPELYFNKELLLFGFTLDETEIYNLENNIQELNEKFKNYFFKNTLGQIVPWQILLKKYNVKNNYISFSINKIKYNNTLRSEEKLYIRRVLNNSFVKIMDRNNERVKSRQKERNQFNINFYNNSKRILNKRTDYSIDLNLTESNNKDSIYMDFRFYSQKKKEVNILIPSILDTRYSFSKQQFAAGNHFDINLKLYSIISIFTGNNKFIRYGEFE
jgi:hypothetical protein